MVGLLRGPAGARSQRPARQPRLGHRPDWPTQPRPEGLGRPVPSFLRPTRAIAWGIPLFSVGMGGGGGGRKGPRQFLQVKLRQVDSAGCQRERGGTTTRALPAPGQSIV
jgi:hypothetical protein